MLYGKNIDELESQAAYAAWLSFFFVIIYEMAAKKILFVENEKALHEVLSGYFKREGYDFISAYDGKEAVEKIKERDVDIVILDIMLPGMDGFEVLKEVRKNSNVPVIMLTARSDEVDKLLGLEMGADDYVTKPFSPRELLARVKAVLRRVRGEIRTEKMKVHGIEFDLASCEVRYNNNLIPLTPTEMKILTLLASSPGRVFTRAQIVRAVSDEYEIEERTVDAHIKNIRKKLAGAGIDPYIVDTSRGFGYRLKKEF